LVSNAGVQFIAQKSTHAALNTYAGWLIRQRSSHLMGGHSWHACRRRGKYPSTALAAKPGKPLPEIMADKSLSDL